MIDQLILKVTAEDIRDIPVRKAEATLGRKLRAAVRW